MSEQAENDPHTHTHYFEKGERLRASWKLSCRHGISDTHINTRSHTTYQEGRGLELIIRTLTRAFSCTQHNITHKLRRAQRARMDHAETRHRHIYTHRQFEAAHTHTHTPFQEGGGLSRVMDPLRFCRQTPLESCRSTPSISGTDSRYPNVLKIPKIKFYTFGMATGANFVYLQRHATRVSRCFGIPTCLRQGC
jgi:hypothetical protein